MKRRETVTAVSDERISLRLESLSGFYADNGEANFTREWAAFSGPSATNQNVTLSFSPAMNVLKFPMCPGGSHEQKLRWEGQQFSGYFTLKSKVAAKEKLAIGGKEFEVFRVEYDTGSQGGVIWYSPELGRPLKGSTRLTEWIVVEYGGS